MTSPGGDEVGRVSVRVVPDSSRFDDELRRQLNDLPDFKVDVTPDFDREELRRQLDEAKAAVGDIEVPVHAAVENIRDDVARATAGLEADAVKVPVELEETGLEAEITRVRAQLDELDNRTVTPNVELLQASFRAQLAELEAELARKREVQIPVEATGVPEVMADMVNIRAAAEALSRHPVLLKFELDRAQLESEIAEVTAELEVLDNKVATPEVRLESAQLQRELKTLNAELDALDAKHLDFVANLNVDTAEARAELALFRARQEANAIHLRVDIDKNRLGLVTSGLAGSLANVFTSLGNGVSQVFSSTIGKAFSAAGGYAEDFGNKLEQVAGPAAQLLQSLGLIAVYTFAGVAAGAALTAAYGVAATTIAAIPATLGLIAGAAVPVLLGLNGIKKAAGSIKPEFDALKASVSDTFEKGLTPIFKNLATIFPKVQDSINNVASALVSTAFTVTQFITSSRGVATINTIFNNTAQAIRNMQPGIQDIISTFLTLASQAGVFDALTSAVNTFGAQFKKNVTDQLRDGTLTSAFTGLKGLLDQLAIGFSDLVKNGVEVFAAAAPGINKSLASLTRFFDRFDWERLGKAVGGVFEGLGQALDNVDTGTLRDIESAFDDVAKTFKDKDFQGNLDKMIRGIGPAIRQLNELMKTFGDIGGAIADVITWVDKIDQKLHGFFDWFNQSNKSDNGAGILTKDAQWWQDLNDFLDRQIQGVKAKWEEFKKVFSGGFDGPSPISTLLGSVGGGGDGGIGSSIIDGLLSAIRIGIGLFAGIMKSLAQAGIDAAKGVLGISSPSTVFIAIGEDITAGLAQGIQNGTAAVVAAIKELASQLASAFNFTGFGTSFGLAFLQMVGTAKLGMESIAATVTTGMGPVRAAFDFTAVGVSLGLAFQAMTGTTKLGMDSLVATVTDGMAKVTTAFSFDNLGLTLGLTFQNLVGTTNLGMLSIAAAVTVGMVGVNAAFNFTTVGATLGLAFQGMVGTTTLGMQSIATAVTTGMVLVNAAFNFTNLNLLLGLAFQGMVGTTNLGMASLAAAVTTGMVLVNAAFNFTNLNLLLGLAFQSMVGTTTVGMASIAAAVIAGMPLVNAAFNFTAANQALGLAFLGMVGTTTLGMASIAAAVAAGMGAINAALIGGMAGVVAAWTASWFGSMLATVTGFWASNIAAVTGGMATVVNVIRGGLSQVVGFWTSNWQTLISVARTAIQGAVSAVQSGMTAVVNAVRSGLSSAVAIARGFVGQFTGVGTALMNGLKAGITAAAGAIASAAAAVVRGALAAARAAGIVHSPSRAMMEIGGYLGEGLAVGLRNSTSQVASAASDAVSSVLDSAQSINGAFTGAEFSSTLSTQVEHSFSDLNGANSNADVVSQIRALRGDVSMTSGDTAILSVLQLIASRLEAKSNVSIGAQFSRASAELGAF